MQALIKVQVTRHQHEADDIASLELAPVDGPHLPQFEAGAHIDVHIREGLVRQYSLYELPQPDGRYRIGVLREPQSRGGSAHLVDAVQEGDILHISAPRNHFALAAGATDVVLLAGGIGITPILCMAQQLARDGVPFTLHYCGRSLPRMAFVERLRAAPWAERVQLHADDGPPTQRLDAVAAVGAPAPGRHLYVCGPTGFMAHVLETASGLGWPGERLHQEYFAAPATNTSCDGAFELELRRSGRRITVPADLSAARALLEAGVDVPVSCEQGVCGSCLTRVLDGEPDHRDLYLTEEERARNDAFLPCCSRAKTPCLVIDL
jgi:vanillate O-demethylase ferredoxin subunit